MLSWSVRAEIALPLASLSVESIVDGPELGNDSWTVERGRLECSDNLLRLVEMLFRDEPARRFGEYEDEGDQENCEEALEGNRNPPRRGIVEVAARRAMSISRPWLEPSIADMPEPKVDPVRHHRTRRNHSRLHEAIEEVSAKSIHCGVSRSKGECGCTSINTAKPRE